MEILSLEFLLFFCLLHIALSLNIFDRKNTILVFNIIFLAFWVKLGILLIFGLTFFTFVIGKQIKASTHTKSKKIFYYLGVSFPIFVLLILNINYSEFGFQFSPFLFIGASYYTLELISYISDVYNDRIDEDIHFLDLLFFISYFPKFLAGPIEKTKNILLKFQLNYKTVSEGLILIAWGIFKKGIIATKLSFYVDSIFSNPSNYGPYDLILATFFYSYQIYCDFSGYVDIVRGVSKTIGINLIRNFNFPYQASSIKEFWNRWHMSFTNWLKNYIYFPLTRSRIATTQNSTFVRLTDYGIILIFILSGLWHGFKWTYLLWGGYHGFLLLLNSYYSHFFAPWISTKKLVSVIMNKIGIGVTFLAVSFGWIFFRVNNLNDATLILNKLLHGNYGAIKLNLTSIEFITSIFFIALLVMIQVISGQQPIEEYISSKNKVFRWAFYVLIMFLITTFVSFENTSRFIYSEF